MSTEYTTGTAIAAFLGLSETETENKEDILDLAADAVNEWLDARVSFDVEDDTPASLVFAANLLGGRFFNRSSSIIGAQAVGDNLVYVSGRDRDAESLIQPYKVFRFA